jgi:probable HAF family extracellular repeat protein
MKHCLLSISFGCLLFSTSIADAASQLYSITQIGPSAAGGATGDFQPVAINASGAVAGTASIPQMNVLFTFIGGIVNLYFVGGHDTSGTARGLNDIGQIIGTESGGAANAFGFIFTPTTFTGLPSSFLPNGINDSSVVVGTQLLAHGNPHADLYSNGVLTDLGTLGGMYSTATAINNNGQIAGNSTLPGESGTHAFLYSGGTMLDLGSLAGTNSYAAAISSNGLIAGSSQTYSNYATHAFLYNGRILDLGVLAGYPNSYATGVNANGQVAGHSDVQLSQTETASHAFIYRDGGIEDLNDLIPANAGWVLETATAINDAGQIVGTGTLNGLPAQGFVLTPYSGGATSCNITGLTWPARELTFLIEDSSSGLQGIAISSSLNASAAIPSFSQGTTAQVTVNAVQVDQTENASIQLLVTNSAGGTTSCGSIISAGPAQWSGLGGILLGNVISAVNAGGELEVFGIGTDYALWHNVQTAPGGTWEGWTSLGGSALVGDPSVGMDSGGRLEVFATSFANGLWNIAQTGPGNWSGSVWQNIGYGVKGRPAVVLDSAGSLQVFARTTNDRLAYTAQQSAGSSMWQAFGPMGGVITSNPVAAVDSKGVVQVFATGTDQALWNIGLTAGGGIFPWTTFGGAIKGNPVALSRFGSVYVFVHESDDSLSFMFQTGGAWSGWEGLGGAIIGDPSVALNSDGRVEAFAIGTDNALWHIWQAAAGGPQWSPWISLGGYMSSSYVTPVSDQDARIDVFAVGGDQGAWMISQSVPGYWN